MYLKNNLVYYVTLLLIPDHPTKHILDYMLVSLPISDSKTFSNRKKKNEIRIIEYTNPNIFSCRIDIEKNLFFNITIGSLSYDQGVYNTLFIGNSHNNKENSTDIHSIK